MRETNRKIKATGVALFYGLWSVVAAHGYSFNEIVPDVRNPLACPEVPPAPYHLTRCSRQAASLCSGAPC